ncbi:MAG: flagellar biosynthesis protein FlhG [Clostridia bacterium]|nr:flagellar biosynthesis protein FlhG [Clostridia bacterium]
MDQAARLRELVREKESGARVLAVVSGKGGVGKTNLTVNLGLVLAKWGYKVLIFDADLGLGNVDILLGLVPRWDLRQVINGEKSLAEIIIRGPAGLQLIPGASGLQELADLDSFRQEKLLQELESLATRQDFVLLDAGAGISRKILSFALAAGEVLVVTTPEPTALTDAYGLIKILARLGTKNYLIVNRVASETEGREAAQRLQQAVRRFLHLDLPLLGFIAEDRAVGQAVHRQQPFVLSASGVKAALDVEAIARKLLGRAASESKAGSDFFQKLGRLFGRRKGDF